MTDDRGAAISVCDWVPETRIGCAVMELGTLPGREMTLLKGCAAPEPRESLESPRSPRDASPVFNLTPAAETTGASDVPAPPMA